MNRQEILAEMVELRERLNKLEKMYDSLTPPNKSWKAENGGVYYFISAGGKVCLDRDNEVIEDGMRYALGNYFKTVKEAQFEIERLKVIAELREYATLADEFDWGDTTEPKYVLEFHTEEENSFLMIDCWHTCQFNDLCFKSEEAAKSAIEAVGEERIIKYYFRRGESNANGD